MYDYCLTSTFYSCCFSILTGLCSFIKKIQLLYLYLSSLKHKNKTDKHLKLGLWKFNRRLKCAKKSWFVLLKIFAFRRFFFFKEKKNTHTHTRESTVVSLILTNRKNSNKGNGSSQNSWRKIKTECGQHVT